MDAPTVPLTDPAKLKKKKPPSLIEEWAVYLMARSAAAVVTTLKPQHVLRLAETAGRIIGRLDKRHRERTLYQLRIAYPEMTDEARHALITSCFEHVAKLALEVVLTPRLVHEDNWPAMIESNEHVGEALELLNRGKPTVMVTGHLGNWEVLGNTLALLGYHVAAIARPLPHKKVNRWLLGIREARGMQIITKRDATDRMQGVMDRGGTLAFIADQNAGRLGVHVPFFGRLACTFKSIALMAMHYQAPLICGGSPRLAGPSAQAGEGVGDGGGLRYGMEVTDIIYPGDWQDQIDPVFYITARFTRALEELIRRHPGQYLWMHRRWKTRPRFELKGKPMPASLERKLEALPWMTSDLMESVRQPVDYRTISGKSAW